MNNKKNNKEKVFLAYGTTLLGVGIVFFDAVNKGVGIGLLTLGLVLIVTGLSKSRKRKIEDISQPD